MEPQQINISTRVYELMIAILCDSSTLKQNKDAMMVVQKIRQLKSQKRYVPVKEILTLGESVITEVKKDCRRKEDLLQNILCMNDELTKDVCITEVRVQASQFPRYEYLLDNWLDIVTRYKNVFRLDGHDLGNETMITFYYCKDIEGNNNIIDDFLHNASAAGHFSENRNFNSFEDFVKSTEKSIISCFVVTGNNMQQALTCLGNRTAINLIIAESDRDARAILRSERTHKLKNTFVLVSNESKQVDTVLEKYILQNLKLIYQGLRKKIETCERRETAENDTNIEPNYYNFGDKQNLVSSVPPQKRLKRSKSDEDRKSKRGSSDQDQACSSETSCFADEQPYVPTVLCINEKMQSTLDKETKVWLLKEIKGIFNMSNVCIEDHENRSGIDMKKISKSLFADFNEIHGIGLRMQKLQIVIKEGQEMDTEEKQSDASGSFGCFAQTKDDSERLLGLLAKHVASTGQHMELKKDRRSVGCIIRETVEDGGPDIAAASLSIPKSHCDTRFKSVGGKARKSNKTHIIPTERLEGQKVHMWGAKSKPGKGIITVPEYICADMDHTLIQVEDIVDGEGIVDERFAQPGDSGAIACIDVPGQEIVNPISMNMGCLNFKEVEEDDRQKVKTQRGKYLTVPLPCGLRKISSIIGKDIELC